MSHSMKVRIILSACISTFVLCTSACTQVNQITPFDSKGYIGENVTVCGIVSSVSNISHSGKNPIFINLGPAYPSQVFTVVVWKEHQNSLKLDFNTIKNKTICVKGVISSYRGIPQIEINEDSKIWFKSNGSVEAPKKSEATTLNFDAHVPVVETKNLSIFVGKGSTKRNAMFWIIPSSIPKDCLFSGLLVSHQDNQEFFEVPVTPMNVGLDGTALTFLVDSKGIDALQESNIVAVNVCGNWVKLKDEHLANIKNALN